MAMNAVFWLFKSSMLSALQSLVGKQSDLHFKRLGARSLGRGDQMSAGEKEASCGVMRSFLMARGLILRFVQQNRRVQILR